MARDQEGHQQANCAIEYRRGAKGRRSEREDRFGQGRVEFGKARSLRRSRRSSGCNSGLGRSARTIGSEAGTVVPYRPFLSLANSRTYPNKGTFARVRPLAVLALEIADLPPMLSLSSRENPPVVFPRSSRALSLLFLSLSLSLSLSLGNRSSRRSVLPPSARLFTLAG